MRRREKSSFFSVPVDGKNAVGFALQLLLVIAPNGAFLRQMLSSGKLHKHSVFFSQRIWKPRVLCSPAHTYFPTKYDNLKPNKAGATTVCLDVINTFNSFFNKSVLLAPQGIARFFPVSGKRGNADFAYLRQAQKVSIITGFSLTENPSVPPASSRCRASKRSHHPRRSDGRSERLQ